MDIKKGELAEETTTLMRLLRAVEPGQLLTYPDINRALHPLFDVQGVDRHHLTSARNILLRERIYFDCIRGVGLRRATSEIIGQDVMPRQKGKVYRSIKRTAKIIDAADVRELDKSLATEVIGYKQMLQFMEIQAKPANLAKLHTHAGADNRQMIEAILDLGARNLHREQGQ